MERAALMAQAFVRAAQTARAEGHKPDVIIVYSGRGAGMFARDLFPKVASLPYCKWWYNHPGPDTPFLADNPGPMTPDI